MNDLATRLGASLGAGYRLGRELGGGGMSRVFVAEEVELGRKVVVKVLPPEMAAGVNAERFRREIQLAASLQHPHVVPVIAAGRSDDLVWYTMPLIEGESLRARLGREGELPIPETVRILRDVADALAYAHAHGVVHRDIKPDNVLVSGRHAVVTDFGVAKAISAATGETSLTSAGLALGTPAYMAPEQAAADPHTDHRADIYALGAVAYEMLAGQPPFAGMAPQMMLAAHVTQAPDPVASRRASVPPALAQLVMRCLEKKAADRYQSAQELHELLDGMATPSGGMTPTSAQPRVERPRPTLTARMVGMMALALVVVAAAVIVWRSRAGSRGPVVDPNVVAVLPFRVTGADPALGYLREGMVDLLAAKLTGQGGPRASDPRSSVSAWRTAGGDQGDLTEEAVIRVARGLGAGQVLLGGVVGSPARLVLSATVLEVPGGRVMARSTTEGPSDSLPAMLDHLVASLLARAAGVGAQTEASLTTTSLEALRAYLDGQAAYRRGKFIEAEQHYRRALQVDSMFALAAMGLSLTVGWTTAQDLIGVRDRAMALKERLSPRDRAILEAAWGPDPISSSAAQELASRERAAELVPDSPESWYLVGDTYFHFGQLLGFADGRSRAAVAFRRALALDSTFGGALLHLINLAAERGDTTELRRLASRYFRQDTSSIGLTASLRWRVALALRDHRERDRFLESLDAIGFAGLQFTVFGEAYDTLSLPYFGRLFEAASRAATTQNERRLLQTLRLLHLLNRGRLADAALVRDSMAAWAPDSVAGFHIGAALDWGGDREAAAREARDLAPVAFAPAAEAESARFVQVRALCALERWRIRTGDATTAERSIARLRSAAAQPGAQASALSARLCAAALEALLAAHRASPDAPSRIAALDSALRSVPGGTLVADGLFFWNLELARLHAQRGATAEALSVARRRLYMVTLPSGFLLAPSLRMEGRLAAQTGDREGAIKAYRWYLALRSEPDARLVPQRDSVRTELEMLERGRR